MAVCPPFCDVPVSRAKGSFGSFENQQQQQQIEQQQEATRQQQLAIAMAKIKPCVDWVRTLNLLRR